MNILGLYGACGFDGSSYSLHDSSATLIADDKLVVSISEERLSRKKYESSFPNLGIEYVLQYAGLTKSNIDIITMTDSPSYDYVKLRDNGEIKKHLKALFPKAKVYFVDHHTSHAASTVLTSNFNSGSFLTLDGGGSCSYNKFNDDFTNFSVSRSSIGKFNTKSFNIYDTAFDHFQNRFGNVYATFAYEIYKRLFPTKIMNNELELASQGKIMGLAAYGNSKNINEKFFVMDFLNRGKIPQVSFFFPNDFWFDQYDPIDIAAYLQDNFEIAFTKFVKELIKHKYLNQKSCFAGGVFLNISCNTILQKLLNKVHIVPFVNDSGLSIGNALYTAFLNKRKIWLPNNLATLGKNYSNYEIKSALKKYNLQFTKFENLKDLSKIVSKKLANNKIIGWFQSKSEQGPRALGCRSIIMSCNKGNKETLNLRIKHREYWRPFAGAILEDNLNEYFIEDFLSPYMLYNYKTKPKVRDIIPAVNHIDNTCRAQTVNKELYPEFFTLLTEYYKLTNIPVLLNTSFNDNNEPIVETPEHAIQCFLKLDLDCLAIGHFLVVKDKDK